MQNLLRQTLWYNFHYYQDLGQGAFKNQPYILQKHVSKLGPDMQQLLSRDSLASYIPYINEFTHSTLPRHHPPATHVHG
jgi:hypothetical protein